MKEIKLPLPALSPLLTRGFLGLSLAVLGGLILPQTTYAQSSDDERFPTSLAVSATLVHSGSRPGSTLLARLGFHPSGRYDLGIQGGLLPSHHSSFKDWPTAVGAFGRYYLSAPATTRHDPYLGEISLKKRRYYVGLDYLRSSDGGDYGGGCVGAQENKYFMELRYLQNKFTGADFSLNVGLILKGW